METIQAQTQTVKGNHLASALGVSSTGIESNGMSSFDQALNKVLGQATGDSTETDAATLMVSGVIPAGVLTAILPQTNLSDATEQLRQFLLAVQSADSEQLQQWLELPAMKQWESQAKQLLGEINIPLAMDAEPVLILEQEDNVDHVKLINQVGHPFNEMEEVVTQLLKLLHNEPIQHDAAKLATSFNSVLNELNKAFPELHSKINTQSAAHHDQIEKSDSTLVTLNRNKSPLNLALPNQYSDNQPSDNSNSQQQFLQRLSYMKPMAQLLVAQNSTIMNASGQAPEGAMNGQINETQLTEEGLTTSVSTFQDSLKAASLEANKSLPVVHSQQFVPELSRFMVKNMSISQIGGVSEARISLVPEHLGQLNVKIQVMNGQITAHFLAESASAREMLENQLPALRTALQQQGLHVEKLVVAHNQGFQSGMFQEHRQQQSSKQSNNGKSTERANELSSIDFIDEVEQAAVRHRISGLGSSFHASA